MARFLHGGFMRNDLLYLEHSIRPKQPAKNKIQCSGNLKIKYDVPEILIPTCAVR